MQREPAEVCKSSTDVLRAASEGEGPAGTQTNLARRNCN